MVIISLASPPTMMIALITMMPTLTLLISLAASFLDVVLAIGKIKVRVSLLQLVPAPQLLQLRKRLVPRAISQMGSGAIICRAPTTLTAAS